MSRTSITIRGTRKFRVKTVEKLLFPSYLAIHQASHTHSCLCRSSSSIRNFDRYCSPCNAPPPGTLNANWTYSGYLFAAGNATRNGPNQRSFTFGNRATREVRSEKVDHFDDRSECMLYCVFGDAQRTALTITARVSTHGSGRIKAGGTRPRAVLLALVVIFNRPCF